MRSGFYLRMDPFAGIFVPVDTGSRPKHTAKIGSGDSTSGTTLRARLHLPE